MTTCNVKEAVCRQFPDSSAPLSLAERLSVFQLIVLALFHSHCSYQPSTFLAITGYCMIPAQHQTADRQS